MDFLAESFNQKAVYWGSPTTDGFGKLSFADPIEIDVRWEDRNELYVNATGKESVSKSIIYSNSQDFENDGYLYLGELSDLSTAQKSNPQSISTAWSIKAHYKKPDIGGNVYFRKVWL